MRELINLERSRFGSLYVLRRDLSRVGETYWVCRCDCGTEKSVFGASLRRKLTTSCGCSKVESMRRQFSKRPFESLYRVLTRNASDKYAHTLTYDEFVEFTSITECHYCGEHITWAKHNVGWNGSRYNLDRKDNSVGYVKENLVVCCKRCNRAKSDSFTYKEWLAIGKTIRYFKESSNATQ